MNSFEIKQILLQNDIRHWQLAHCIGISPYTLSVWLRQEVSGEREKRVQAALKKLTGGGDNGRTPNS